MTNPCTEQNCERQLFKDGLCQFHYMKHATDPRKVFAARPQHILQAPKQEPKMNFLGTIVANLALLWIALFLTEQVIKVGTSLFKLLFG